jgi:hypothetical protein
MLDNWQERFPNCEPIGYRLREVFRDRWVRFHSLPESKRYPECPSEYQMILQRHSCVLSELLGTERRVILLTTGYSETPQPVRSYTELDAIDPTAKPWRTIAMHSESEEFTYPNYWHVFASEWEWQPGVFDSLVQLVADAVIANVSIVHPECRWVLYPYDGGMDVIAETPTARDQLRAAHRDWLSSLESGL